MLAINKGKSAYFSKLDHFQKDLQNRLFKHYGQSTFSQLLATKIANFFAAEYHYQHGHAWLASRPVELTIDPSNGCQLRCPGCVHSSNPDWSALFDWPKRSLNFELYQKYMAAHGPYAAAAVFYNYGEPLLNRRLPQMIRIAKEYLLFTMTSSNLSLNMDAGAIVRSGLDRLIVSADGASQAGYEQYRRRGELNKVLINMRKLVEARNKLGIQKPYISWQYLVFEHNEHEVQKAIDLAAEIGVDEIHIAEPFAVDGDDKTMRPVQHAQAGRIVFHDAKPFRYSADDFGGLSRQQNHIHTASQTSWVQRSKDSGKADEPSQHNARACPWLYHNLTMDGAARIMPCCIAPSKDKGHKHLVFGQYDPSGPELVNSANAVLSRLYHSNRPLFEQMHPNLTDGHDPYCMQCDAKPKTPNDIAPADYVGALDFDRIIPEDVYRGLSEAVLYRR